MRVSPRSPLRIPRSPLIYISLSLLWAIGRPIALYFFDTAPQAGLFGPSLIGPSALRATLNGSCASAWENTLEKNGGDAALRIVRRASERWSAYAYRILKLEMLRFL